MDHDFYMRRCLDLAWKGRGWVVPNPMVGCVIVHDNQIVAEGYHEKFGASHAEVNAIQNLPPGIQPENCMLYVNLEPCSHFGKTPPCANLIIQKGFKKVVVGQLDPNPLVAGKGIKRLIDNGTEVICGVLEKECRYLNRRFVYFHENQKPWITLKWAQTADGFISRYEVKNREENKITSLETDKWVHELRSMHQAILVGKNTILFDDPRLNVRLFNGKNPLRIVLGFDEKMLTMNIHKKEYGETVFFLRIKPKNFDGTYFEFDTRNPYELIEFFKKLNVQSVLVEGGKKVLDFFLGNKLFNEIICITSSTKKFHEGLKSPDIPMGYEITDEMNLGKDFFKNVVTFF